MALLLVLLIFGVIVESSPKPHDLNILIIAPDWYGRNILRSTAEVVAAYVNNRSDILPDYNIKVIIVDEGVQGVMTTKQVVEFSRNYDNKSPIVIGGSVSNGCKSIGPVLHHLNLVLLSPICASPVLTDRTRFPNLYLMFSTGRTVAMGFVRFIVDVGKWTRFALDSTATSLNDYTTAIQIYQVAVEAGIQVPFFDVVLQVTHETVADLKSQDMRIITLLATLNPQFFWTLICELYKENMIGPQYVLLTTTNNFVIPGNIPAWYSPSCSRAMLVSAMKYTVFISQKGLDESSLTSSLGLNSTQFHTMLLNHSPNITRAYDYLGYLGSFDSVMKGLFSLDEAEKTLKKQRNMTLKDYHADPDLVMRVANSSLRNSDYVGLRIGRMVYGPTGEVDNDIQSVSAWNSDSGLKSYFMVRMKPDSKDKNVTSFETLVVPNIIYRFPNGNPPRDQRMSRELILQPSETVTWIILALALLLTGFQAGGCGAMIMARKKLPEVEKGILMKVFGLIGCFVLNVAAVCFVWPVANLTRQYRSIWIARNVLLAFGASIVHASLAFPVLFIWRTARSQLPSRVTFATNPKLNPRHSSAVFPSPSTKALKPSISPSTQARILKEVRKLNKNYGLGFVLLNLGIAVIWMNVEVILCGFEDPKLDYDVLADSLTVSRVFDCNSRDLDAMIGLLLSINFLLLLAGNYSAYQLSRKRDVTVIYPDFVLTRLGLVNCASALVGGVLILAAINGNATMGRETLAFECIYLSGCSSTALMFQSLKQLYQK